MNGKPPLVFEDGRQQRDFVHVHDVVRARLLALETMTAQGCVFNVGSGRRWLKGKVAEDRVDRATAKLESWGLVA
jgi:dTDP-L-rhamnose 4-epimerase